MERPVGSATPASYLHAYVHRKSKTMDVHIGSIIKEELLRQGRTASWLARALYCDRSNVYKLFKKRSLDSDLLLRISEALRTDFFHSYSASLVERGIGYDCKPFPCNGTDEAGAAETATGACCD